VVATSLVAKQLGWEDGTELLVADAPEAFARQCARLHADPTLWQRLREAALVRVQADCDPAGFRENLIRILRSVGTVTTESILAPQQPLREHSHTPLDNWSENEVGVSQPVFSPRDDPSLARDEFDNARLISQSDLFDAGWYISKYNDVKAAGIDPAIHYLRVGAKEGRDPHPLFDTDWYLKHNPDVAESGLNPLVHYLRWGAAEGRVGHPLSFREGRTSPSIKCKYPEAYVPDLFEFRSIKSRGAIAVVLHLYYPDLWDEIREAIERISVPFDLFVSLVNGKSDHMRDLVKETFRSAFIFEFENRGRDIGPFLVLLQSGVLFQYDLVLKLHTKRSPHYQDGDLWRRALIDGVLGSSHLIERILATFRSDPDLGMVVADGSIYRAQEHWAGTEKLLAGLLPRIGISPDVEGRVFPGGSIFWIRPFLLRTLAGAGIELNDFEPEPIQIDGSLAHAVERMFGLICEEAGMRVTESTQLLETVGPPLRSPSRVHIVAYYLPQYHPIPENDGWWGAGFTEWTNVTRAKPLFKDHRQPRLPADLGFYDLRLAETREAQAVLARDYGLSAFCYYFYWLDGHRVLERPLNEVLIGGKPDFPLMICWANEPWTRNWDGLSSDILLPQTYQPGWVTRFARDIVPLLNDCRYFRLDGKPMLLIYRVGHIPEPATAMQQLRVALLEEGIPDIHLAAGWVSFPREHELPPDPRTLGLDAYFEFPPHMLPPRPLRPFPSDLSEEFAGLLYDYNKTVTAAIEKLDEPIEGRRHRCVMLGWDNTARRGARAHIWQGATPANFRRWLRGTVMHESYQGGERVVFVNAWNEWAEGTYLEPDAEFGCGWLEAVASATDFARSKD
jgi:lipopolysaccharide biosynthesis protein